MELNLIWILNSLIHLLTLSINGAKNDKQGEREIGSKLNSQEWFVNWLNQIIKSIFNWFKIFPTQHGNLKSKIYTSTILQEFKLIKLILSASEYSEMLMSLIQ